MRTLLLADDSVTVQRVIALTFAGEQVQVITAGDGRQAMEKMVAQPPDIVLAGTTLPHVNGYDLAKFMRSNPVLAGVPVLLLTGAFEAIDEVRLAASGANGVIEKPVEPNVVISRVNELLGLKPEARLATAGRLIRSSEPAPDKRPVATPPRAVTSTRETPSRWEQLRDQSGLEANAASVEDSSTRPDDYLDTLDAAFDSLDQQLSGRLPTPKSARNPAPPLGQTAPTGDPRSPGRRPDNRGVEPGNPVFEVDHEWFGGGDSQASTGRRELAEDLRDPVLQSPAAPASANPIFEVDDEWFSEDKKARAAKTVEQRLLAAEMGIHEVALPAIEGAPPSPAPAVDLDVNFDVEDLLPPRTPAPSTLSEMTAMAPLVPPPVAPPAIHVASTPIAARVYVPSPVADDFAALLAYEEGERSAPPDPAEPLPVAAAAPEVVTPPAPEITEDMLDQIATRVAERLQGSALEDRVTAAMNATVQDTVKSIVSETSERLVRDAVQSIVSETSERLVRDAVQSVVSETSERLVRDTVQSVVSEASERLVRDAVQSVVSETSERLVRDTVQSVVSEASERLVRDAMQSVVSETSERLVRDAVQSVVSETSQRLVRETVRSVVTETSERVVRETVPSVVSETSERLVGENVRPVVSEASERLVRAEIDRIKSKKSS